MIGSESESETASAAIDDIGRERHETQLRTRMRVLLRVGRTRGIAEVATDIATETGTGTGRLRIEKVPCRRIGATLAVLKPRTSILARPPPRPTRSTRMTGSARNAIESVC